MPKKIEEEKIEEVKEKKVSDKPEVVIGENERNTSKKPEAVKEGEAVINIYTSFNNTIVHVTDMSGKTITKVTGGMVTKHNRLKANPTIAMFIAKRIAEDVKDLGVKSFYVRIRAKTRNPAPGPGAHTIIKSLTREGFKILNILDTTRVPRGGPKKKGGRRGRRP
jgi:small subunit ribosomal protein S11